MFLGLLIGLSIWGLLLIMSHRASIIDINYQRRVAVTDPKVLDSIRLHGMIRIIGLLAFLMGACGAVGWCLEVFV